MVRVAACLVVLPSGMRYSWRPVRSFKLCSIGYSHKQDIHAEANGGMRWSEAEVVSGSQRWIEMIRSCTICPLAEPDTTKIVVSASGLKDWLFLTDDLLENIRPPGFEMVDERLLREEAALLLSGDAGFRASTMIVHPYALKLDGMTAAFTEAEFLADDSASSVSLGTEEEMSAAVVANYERNRWLQKIMPSDEVQPLPFYPFFLSRNGIEFQTMPWFSVQLIRRSELAAARGVWCRKLGMTEEEYDESGQNPRVARRRHLVNAAAPELTELFLDVRRGDLPDSSAELTKKWRQTAERCAEREELRWASANVTRE